MAKIDELMARNMGGNPHEPDFIEIPKVSLQDKRQYYLDTLMILFKQKLRLVKGGICINLLSNLVIFVIKLYLCLKL